MCRFNFTPFPILETERVTLRPLRPEDEHEIFLLRSDENVNKYLDRQKANDPEDARAFIKKITALVEGNEGLYWVISLKGDPKLLGTIGYFNLSLTKCKAELGYELLPDFEGRGLMHEALSKAIQYGFENMRLEAIEAFSNPHNLRSIRLLEKNGFKRDPARNESEIAYVLKRG